MGKEVLLHASGWSSSSRKIMSPLRQRQLLVTVSADTFLPLKGIA